MITSEALKEFFIDNGYTALTATVYQQGAESIAGARVVCGDYVLTVGVHKNGFAVIDTARLIHQSGPALFQAPLHSSYANIDLANPDSFKRILNIARILARA